MTRNFFVFLIVLAIVAAPVLAWAANVTLTDEQAAHCEAEGGCVVASKKAILELIEKAYAAGRERGSISCGNKT